MMTAYLECLQKERITAQQNVSLKKLCSFQIGGNARVVVYPDSTEALCRAVSLAVECGIRFFIVGKGSNLLFADEGFDGVIICTGKVNGISIIGSSIRAECGVSLGTLSRLAHEHSLTGFENGGEIKGNSFSGDNIPIMANAGEVVLTRAMAGNVAAQLQGSGSNVHVTGELRGESIFLAVNRSLKRKGKGELVTWK